jgi:glutathione S-transferase
MKLRYSPTSPYVRKVVVLALETGLSPRIERIATNVAPNQRNDEYQREQPLAKVPALTTDDGTVLYDSRVICEYLDSLHQGAKLFPPAGPARWTALRRQALGDGLCDAAILTRYETFLRPEDKRWEDWVEGQMRKVRAALDALEAEAPALGSGLDIGLIAIGCALGYMDFRYESEQWRAKRPKLAAWYETFAALPSMRETAPK